MTRVIALPDRIHRLHGELTAFLERRAPGAGEELAQEVWFRVARARPELPDDDAFRAYAYVIARRLLIDHHRRRMARVQLVALEGGLDPRDPGEDPHGHAQAARLLDVVEATLSEMKPELAEVFRLRTTSDVPFQEIALRQGTGLNTALGRMHQAVRRLHQALVGAGLIDPGEGA